ncbi:MAG: Ni/Fe hydrogenase subunit alpha [Nitrospinota bacterium]
MKKTYNIDVHHLRRVEGHGDIHIKVKNGKLIDSKWSIVETPRFFESMLQGLSYEIAPALTSRICGICSIGHTLASLRATENAMGVKIPKDAEIIRLLAKHGETIQSHMLHVFFLAAPDFLNVGSVIPLITTHPDLVKMAARLKGLGNDICDVVAGRRVHPVRLITGGVTMAPSKKELEELKTKINQGIEDIMATAELFRTLKMPDFVRETEFVALKGKKGCYPWIGGDLISTDGVVKKEDAYLAMTNEYTVEFSNAKMTKLSRKSFAVGALARINNNYKFLEQDARHMAEVLGLAPVCHNPFMNTVAQIVECYHIMLESLTMIDRLLDSKLNKLRSKFTPKAGRGVGAVEVPRGILYHEYTLDSKGTVKKANCIIPTTQNNANIHHDMSELVVQELESGRDDTDIEQICKMLVRAYDPCISCSVH